MTVERLTLTADEVAESLGLDRKGVYAAASAGEIPARRVGRRWIFSRTAIENWLASAPDGPQATPRRRRTARAVRSSSQASVAQEES
jgi:excisionase family DNA binding protein